MDSSVSVDHVVLRNSTPTEAARHLRGLSSSTADLVPITAHLYDAVTRGSIPHVVFSIWTPMHHDAESTIASLRQSESLLERRVAIKAFIKALRSPESLAKVWDAAGGTSGVARLMSGLSVDEIKLLCNGLAKTASLSQGQSERRARLTELVELLYADKTTDPRPLQVYYKRIFPACTTDKVAEYEKSQPTWSERQRSILRRTHPSIYEAKFLESIFSKDAKDAKVDEEIWTSLIDSNLGFAKQLLSKLLESDGPLPIESPEFTKLAEHIVKRLRRRRPAAEKSLPFELLELLVKLFRRYPDLTEDLNARVDGIISYVIDFWEHTRTTRLKVQRYLIELIGLAPASEFISAEDIVALLRTVSPAVSYQLFRLVIQSAQHYQFDIEDVSDKANGFLKKLKGPWPSDLFISFANDDPDASLHLFERLIAVFPDARFIEPSDLMRDSILESPKEPETDKGDPYILEALLVRKSRARSILDSELMERIEKRVQHCKEKASTSRDWVFRSGWSKIALNLCVAAGSHELFSDTISWVRRFNKDPNTVQSLYLSGCFLAAETFDLLSGIPSNPTHLEKSKDSIKERVEFGNKILLHLLETASMGLREPGFQEYHWYRILLLPRNVVAARFRGANRLHDALQLSDDEMIDLLWKPTLEFALEAEEYLLRPGMERLYPREVRGFLYDIDFDFAKYLRPNSSMFLNQLAMARDKMWENYRPKHYPAVHDLGDAWPRGLPVQYLCPDDVKDVKDIPFVYSKVESVVFASPDSVLQEVPTEKELRAAIGPFVDDYNYALQAYLNSTDDGAERDNRIRKAWRHAVDNLTGDRMTKRESLRFWADIFVERNELKLPPDVKAETLRRPQPAIPDVEDPDTPNEWDPRLSDETGEIELDEAREIPATILDMRIKQGYSWASSSILEQEVLWEDSIWTEVEEHESFWSLKRHGWPSSWKTKDSLAVALLLFLNTLEGSDTSILKKAFPSSTDVRYPALYLDQSFMDAVDQEYFDYNHVHEMSNLIRLAPASLLAQVARSVLEAVEATEKSDPDALTPTRLCMRLIRLVANSDRPSLAFPLISDVILCRPDDSSWHRKLFNKGFFNRLPPRKAAEFLNNITDSIQTKLEEQENRSKEAKEQEPNGLVKSPSLVKVSTVTMLAKLLSDASFLDEKTPSEVLSRLLEKSQHVDIRNAIIESLYGALAGGISSSTKDNIISLLEKNAVPIASSFNERTLASVSWEDVEAGDDLPCVSVMESENVLRQIFTTWDQRFSEDLDVRKKLAALTSKIVKESAENNRRWVEVFLKRFGFELPPGEVIHPVPVNPGMLAIFGRNPEFLSRTEFDMMRGSVLAQICPPPGVAAVTKQVRDSPSLSESDAGKHWLYMFGGGSRAINLCGTDSLLKTMHHATGQQVSDSSERVTSDMLQKFALEVFQQLIYRGDVSRLESLVNSVTPTITGEKSPEAVESWKSITLPILQKVIATIEELRTLEWQRNPERKPKVLPDSFRLKVATLVLPLQVDQEEAFVNDVSGLINELVDSGVPYHHRWDYLKQSVINSHIDWKPYLMRLAVPTGTLHDIDVEKPTLASYLRIEFARHLLENGFPDAPKGKAVVAALKKMLHDWVKSPVEEFRRHAREVVHTLKHASDNEWFSRGEPLQWAETEDGDSDGEGDFV
ncbi:uncharacterized protein CTRU02_210515 [Colletotrichum truncatum]|uniref:Uncharacterized protein n=1 Tax=Colletotrichum truncatum TaxID=5467 RepID=A0ACC3YPB6_COLTU|nr:uncharacterized protein CTRU02_12714 [Colletotrichum truncatum]KAF6784185.1 hypothetical protein CTRU02_12714 [Colletotrichum truncatum]